MINKAFIIGNLGQDPEKKFTQKGIAMATFSVATTEKWKDKTTGEDNEQTEWHRIVTFNRLAEICSDYLRKGSKVYIEGKLRTRSWEKDGVRRYTTEIVAQEMKMLDSKSTDIAQNHDKDIYGILPGSIDDEKIPF